MSVMSVAFGVLNAAPVAAIADNPAEAVEHIVTTTADSGPGSLRAVMEAANATPGPDRIGFGDADGPFSVPRTIELRSPLPPVAGEISIDGHIRNLLWRKYGATVSGANSHQVFRVPEGAVLELAGITIRHGRADFGGAVVNRGRLVMEGVSVLENEALKAGGGVANQGGEAWVINSTLADNRAAQGGAVANLEGTTRIINSTLYRNSARSGAAVYSTDRLSLANSILAGDSRDQCVNTGSLDPATTHNIHPHGEGCGTPIVASDPMIGAFGYYNGPTPLFTLRAGSPAINLGDNAAAVGEDGLPLKWDQRGNGDPRRVSGYTDIGAFEQQGLLPGEFIVDSVDDTGLRACSGSVLNDCPLRAAIELASAARRPTTIRFDPHVFSMPRVIRLESMPPVEAGELVMDGAGASEITVVVPAAEQPWRGMNGVSIQYEAGHYAGGGSP